ncbi:RES domain-containing protein [Microbacterium sp. SL62]|nr:RES domain-containing protein [Microbacterium sp. SL62]
MTPARAKVPEYPPAPLTLNSSHIRSFHGLLWRIYNTKGRYPQRWDEMRHHGPVGRMRFDPHPSPMGFHPDHSVMYSALKSDTAFAEVFYQKANINRRLNGATLVSWLPTRELQLLDLTTTWPVQNGASATLMMGAKKHTRNWAHEIHQQLGSQIDGLYHLSSITSEPMVTLFTRAEDSFPGYPSVQTRLDDAGANMYVARAAKRFEYRVTR